jgi:hypothetical protein
VDLLNTTCRGDAFERRVFEALSVALAAERLGLVPKAANIYHKKPYYSRDRDSAIVVDISIEVTLPGATTWSFLWAWECKDYSGPVPVSDVEEFWAKLRQIGGVNIKGGIACSGPVSHGAFSFARAQGMSLVRLLPQSHVDWLLHWEADRGEARRSCTAALLDQEFRGFNQDLYALEGESEFATWQDLVRRVVQEASSRL